MAASGLPTYEDLHVTIEKIVAMKSSRWSFPGMDSDDIAQEVRLLCFQALQKYDPEKEGKGVFYFLVKCVDNGLYNKGRGIYFDNNPPCMRCPDYNKATKICCGSPRKAEYDARMARRRAIDNPMSLHGSDSTASTSDFEPSPFEIKTAVGSITGVINLDEHIQEKLDPELVPHYMTMVNGGEGDVPIAIRRQIREMVKEILDE